LLGRDSSLPKNARKCAHLQLAMIWNYATYRTSAHNDVTAALPDHGESETLERSNGLST
jgi:hypothetical protein